MLHSSVEEAQKLAMKRDRVTLLRTVNEEKAHLVEENHILRQLVALHRAHGPESFEFLGLVPEVLSSYILLVAYAFVVDS